MAYFADIPYITGLKQQEEILRQKFLELLEYARGLKDTYAICDNDSFFKIITKRLLYFPRKERRLEVLLAAKTIGEVSRRYRHILEMFEKRTDADEILASLKKFHGDIFSVISDNPTLLENIDRVTLCHLLKMKITSAEVMMRFREGKSVRKYLEVDDD